MTSTRVHRQIVIMESSRDTSIVTLTMNPALDITTEAERVHHTEKVRCGDARYDPGGGGVNVAQVARNLGATVAAIYPAGGSTGDTYTELLMARGLNIHRIHIGGATRESFTVNETATGRQFRFVLPGPCLTFVEQQRCLAALRRAATSAQFVVASGSLPPGVPLNFYQQVALVCRDLDVPLILDTSGGGLRHITSGVLLLKASVRELRESARKDLVSEAAQVAAARDIIDRRRAQAVVVSLGSRGALLVTPEANLRFAAIPRQSVSGVGAGDAMVAGITVGLSRGWSLSEAVRLGTAAGAAMLGTPGTQPCDGTDVERLFAAAPEPTEICAVPA